MIKAIKKLSIAVTSCALLFIANPSYSYQAGCNSEFWEIQDNHSRAMRARDHGLVTQVIAQNDSVLALTCFDEAVLQSAKAGDIFSDPSLPPNPLVMDLTQYLDDVPTHSLGRLGEYHQNTDGTQRGTDGFGYTLLAGIYWTTHAPMDALFRNFLYSSAFNFASGQQSDLESTIPANIRDMLGAGFPTASSAGIVENAAIMGFINSGLNDFDCDNSQANTTIMYDVWVDRAINQGTAAGTPFFDSRAFMAGTVTGAGVAMASVYNANRAVHIAPANTNMNELENPGSYTWYKDTPTLIFTPNVSVQNIINAM